MQAKAGIPLWDCAVAFLGYGPVVQDEKHPAVYIMASRRRGTICIGVTRALWVRVCNHKNEKFKDFTSENRVKTLAWYEHHTTMPYAIRREKQMKAWKRAPSIRWGDGEVAD